MKYFKIIFVLVSSLIFTGVVIAENQRTRANPDIKIEVRSVEDIVNDPDAFISINPGDNAVKMSSTSSRDKSKTVTSLATGIAIAATQTTGIAQLQSNNKDVVKKYNRFSDKEGEKKNKKNR